MTQESPDDRLEQMVSRYEAGASLKNIAEELGISAETVRQKLLSRGVAIRPRGATVFGSNGGQPTATEKEIIAGYREGASIRALGRTHGVSEKAISNLLKRHGIQLRPPSRKPLIGTQRAEAVKLYGEGLSGPDVAARLVVSKQTVWRALREEGVIRPGGPANRLGGVSSQGEPTEMEKKVIADYQAGASLRQLAEKYGTNVNPVRDLLIRHGVERRPSSSYRRTSAEKIAANADQIAKRHRAGESIRSIAREFGIPESTLREHLKATKP